MRRGLWLWSACSAVRRPLVGACDRVIWRRWPGSGRFWRPPSGFYPPAIASCRPIGLRLTSAAAQLACSRAFSLPM